MGRLKNDENTSSAKIESGMTPITVKDSDDARASKHASSIDRTVTFSGSQTKISEFDAWKKANPDTKYKKVAFSEMKFFGVRSEVLNAMKYPHFECDPVLNTTVDGAVVRELMNDEMAFCKNLQSAGYDIMVNTDIVLGNEVRIIV